MARKKIIKTADQLIIEIEKKLRKMTELYPGLYFFYGAFPKTIEEADEQLGTLRENMLDCITNKSS